MAAARNESGSNIKGYGGAGGNQVVDFQLTSPPSGQSQLKTGKVNSKAVTRGLAQDEGVSLTLLSLR